MEDPIKQMIKDRSEVSRQIMRDIHFLIEKLNEAGEQNFVGTDSGWKYSFVRTEEKKPEDLT